MYEKLQLQEGPLVEEILYHLHLIQKENCPADCVSFQWKYFQTKDLLSLLNLTFHVKRATQFRKLILYRFPFWQALNALKTKAQLNE